MINSVACQYSVVFNDLGVFPITYITYIACILNMMYLVYHYVYDLNK